MNDRCRMDDDAGAEDALGIFGAAVADDAEMLAALHDRELDEALLKAIRAYGFPDNLGLLPDGESGEQAMALMSSAVNALPDKLDSTTYDALAADYAGIYLNNSYRASPFESAWTDEDGLLCQRSMFELRQIYAKAGMRVNDWRMRSEDHLVSQLLFLAVRARKIRTEEEWRELGKTLDEHLLFWLEDFCTRVWSRCDQPFYAGLAALTVAWCESMRKALADALDTPRMSRDEVTEKWRRESRVEAVPLVYYPGAGPTI